MNNFKRYTQFTRLESNDKIVFFLVVLLYFSTLILIPINLSISLFLFSIQLVLTLFLLVGFLILKKKSLYPKFFLTCIILFSTHPIITFGVFLIKIEVLIILGVFTSLLMMLSVFCILLYYIFNIVYYFYLKRRFPYEKKEHKEELYIDFSELSKYMDLEKQKVYINLEMFNISLYILSCFLFILLIIKYQVVDPPWPNSVRDWLLEQSDINISLLLAVISILIGIYSITFPKQTTIINEAIEEMEQDKEKREN